MERMSATDAGFFYAEHENTPMHVGSVAVFEGPAPTYGDVVRLLLSKLPLVPRYRQRVRTVPFDLGRPLWVDDEHFQILYHVRHTAVPRPGGPEQLRNLAGRVLGQRLDLTKPLWEAWLVEGLEDDRWALISKVHHCMVDGVAGTDLMQLIFDVDPDATHPEPQPWTPQREPSTLEVLAAGLADAVAQPTRHLENAVRQLEKLDPRDAPRLLADRAAVLSKAAPRLARQAWTAGAPGLNGPIGPHRRWVWAQTSIGEIKQVRRGLGGTVNDVVLTAITRGFRDLLAARGTLEEGTIVRTMVPVSVRRPDERGALNNQVSAVFVDLPVGEPSARERLNRIRSQMDEYKQVLGAVDARSIIAMGDFVAPTLLALGTRVAARTTQSYSQAVTTNVPGPPVPLYVLGRPMRGLYSYVPIGSGLRVSIGIYSYIGDITFGINVDFDAFPDVEVLANGISAGMAELLELAGPADEAPARATPPRRRTPRTPSTRTRTTGTTSTGTQTTGTRSTSTQVSG